MAKVTSEGLATAPEAPEDWEPIRLAGATLGANRHVCAFFDSREREEQYRALLPFIKEGIDRGEDAFHIVDHQLHDDHLRRLAQADVDDLLEYETRVNLIPRHKDPVICTYDLSKFGADMIIDVLRTHPMMILAGALRENPFFVPPGELLREIHDRKQRRAVLSS